MIEDASLSVSGYKAIMSSMCLIVSRSGQKYKHSSVLALSQTVLLQQRLCRVVAPCLW